MKVMAAKFLHRVSKSLHRQPPAPVQSPSLERPGTGFVLQGRYRLEHEIGRGGMGTVFRAYDLANDRQVAVKILSAADQALFARQQFAREAEIGARLHHPHIVSIYEAGTLAGEGDERIPYLVMEWVRGPALDQIQGFTYPAILEIGKQICEALEYAHSQGILYRDLKPENILVEKRGFQPFVKLTDFGVAYSQGMTSLDTDMSIVGTFFYLAPELILGQSASVVSDLYALGATLYEMTTGRAPFSDFDRQTVLTQHLEAPVVPPSHSRDDIPPELESVILRLLAKDPADRFASARVVYAALSLAEASGKRQRERGNLPLGISEQSSHPQAVEKVKELFELGRVVTLLDGSPELVRELGAQWLDYFPDGVWWLDLERIEDPARVKEAAAGLFGISPNQDRPLMALLVESLRDRKLLLLIQAPIPLLGACRQLVEAVLDSCPDVHSLVISPQALQLTGETSYHLSA